MLGVLSKNEDDYDVIKQGDKVILPDIRTHVDEGETEIPVKTSNQEIVTLLDFSARQRQHLLAGGTLNIFRRELNT